MKRFLAMILVVALVLSIPIAPVAATQEENVTVVGDTCPCGCGKAASEINWKPYNVNDEGAPADGHYYLTADYAQKQQFTIMAGDRVVIDLRGYTLNTSGYGRLFLVYGYLAVMDTVGGGRMCSKTSGNAFGGVVIVSMNETADPTFAFHSGTLTVDPDNKSSLAGGIVAVGEGSRFIMYGGKIVGGSTTEKGGAIRGSDTSSDIQILGGSVIGGKATGDGGAIWSNGNVTLKNCRISGGQAGGNGGNIYQTNGTLTIENAVIEHGASTAGATGGGNIYMHDRVKVNIKNSTITNGYAAKNGGNICAGYSTVTLENTTINKGVASGLGGNLYLGYNATAVTVADSEIAGDVYCADGKLTLQKATKIGMNNNGLKIAGATMVDAFGLTDGAEIYVDAEKTFTGNGANAAYFKPAGRTVLSTVDGQLAGAKAASGAMGGYCPHCKQQVAWTEAGTTLSGHCYLATDVTTGYSISGDAVVDLNGHKITSENRAFYIPSGASLTLLDSVGGATVKGGGVAGEAGGVLCNLGTLTVYGGNYIYTAGKTLTSGGVIYTAGNTTIHGGFYDGSAINNTAEKSLGGVLNMESAKLTFTMTAGRAIGGNVYAGGTLNFGQENTVDITGGSFLGGTAAGSGANLRFNGASGKVITATVKNVLISGGVATTSAGTLYLNYCNLDLENSLVMGGKANSYGGNVMLGTRGFVDATDCTFSGGTAPMGGNVYASSYVCGANFVDCTVTGGQATDTTGGNFMINHGNVTFTGGEISYGVAKTHGGNVYNNGANYNDTNAKDDGFRLYASQKKMPIITTGKAGNYGGNIYIVGVTEFNSGFINNGSAATGKDIYYTSNANLYSLVVGAGLTGNISLCVVAENFTGSEVVKATAVEFAGKLLLENKDNQPLTVKDGKLVLGSIAVVAADGSTQWVADMVAAQAAYTDGGYIQIFADATMTLTKDCAIDLNGKTLTVSGDYTLYGMDSSGDDYTVGTGKAVLNGNAKTALCTTVADGRDYISIVDGSTATYHRLGMQLTDITLRTATCGVYYKAAWNCDPQLAALVDGFGIALSVYKQPDENFATDSQVMSVDYEAADLVNGQKKTSVAINNIMKGNLSATSNEERGQMPIYANAYLQLTDGTKLMSRNECYSLKTAMERLDNLITEDPTMFRRYTREARALYESWKEKGMQSWSLTNIPTPVEDDVIEVLMVGASFCYYYVEELYGLAAAAGIKMRVCNVYYSGCKLDQHYNWWVGNKANYQFYVTDENGRRGTNNVSLEYCLAQGDWDFISLQQSNDPIRRDTPAVHLENVALYTDTLINYFRQEFPKAEFLWHQTWASQIGYDRGGYKVTSFEQQTRDTAIAKEFAILLGEKYDCRRVPSGSAWQIVREGGYDNLCARLGVGTNNEGDYYHEGDIGGAQYLNACVWFETLTGLSCVGNSYAPVYTKDGKTYTLEADFIATLQNAAHQAVEDMKAGV